MNEIIVVEGKYDAAKVKRVADAIVVQTDGFGIFNDAEKKLLIETLGKQNGIIVLTDSDSSGFKIRNYLNSIYSKLDIKNAYIKEIRGKEKRKSRPSKELLLGVEAVEDSYLIDVLKGVTTCKSKTDISQKITYLDLYELGLSGGEQSKNIRSKLLQRLNLPTHLSKKAALEVLNCVSSKEEIEKLTKELA